MKTKTLFASGVIAVALILSIIISRKNSENRAIHAQVSKAPAETPVHIASQTRTISGTPDLINSATSLRGPAARAVRNTLARNPTLKLSAGEIEAVEESFAKHYMAFSVERNRMVTGQATGVDSYEIQIPSCPEIGLKSLNAFLNELRQLTIGDKEALMPVAKKMFEGYTEQAGRNGVTYSIQFKEDSDMLVKYTREVAMIDPATGKVSGTGITYGELDLRNVDPVLVTAIQNANKK